MSRPSHARGRLRLLSRAVGWLVLSVTLWAGAASAQPYSDVAVKAAFLYRFASYVEWPPDALNAPQFTIAVLDDAQLAADLQKLLPGHLIKDRPVEVRVIHRAAELGSAQVLFVGHGDVEAHRRLIGAIASKPILVVTDEDRGLEEGSMVNFLSLDRRVRFEISLIAAERAGLHVSSELLSVAARVEGHLRSEIRCMGPQAPHLLRCQARTTVA